MTTPVATAHPGATLRVCLWCAIAVLVEVALYASYRGHDARLWRPRQDSNLRHTV